MGTTVFSGALQPSPCLERQEPPALIPVLSVVHLVTDTVLRQQWQLWSE